MKTTIKEITPQWAKNILATRNPRNRPLSLTRAEVYARDMKAGLWQCNHQGIAFDTNGDLGDGQHRLLAVTLGEVPVKMLVTTGLAPEFFDNIDGGRPRGVGQMLVRDGVKNGNATAAAVRALANWCINEGNWLALSVAQTREIHCLVAKPLDALISASRSALNRPKSAVIAPLAFYGSVHSHKAIEFAEKLFTLQNVSKHHPAMSLAKWCRNHPGNGSNSVYACRVCASAISHYHKSNDVEKLYDSSEASKWLLSLNKPLVEKIRALIGK